jgi:hypothetical protein
MPLPKRRCGHSSHRAPSDSHRCGPMGEVPVTISSILPIVARNLAVLVLEAAGYLGMDHPPSVPHGLRYLCGRSPRACRGRTRARLSNWSRPQSDRPSRLRRSSPSDERAALAEFGLRHRVELAAQLRSRSASVLEESCGLSRSSRSASRSACLALRAAQSICR